MPKKGDRKPRVGDKLIWHGDVWELLEMPRKKEPPAGETKLEAKARCVESDIYTPKITSRVVFEAYTVLASGWEFYESEFQRFVRETLGAGQRTKRR